MNKKKVVFLDRDTSDIGDIDFSKIESLGEVAYFGNTALEDISDRIAGTEIILTNKVPIGAEAMDAAKNLEVIQVVATGVNNVDLDAARDRGIKVFNVSGYSTPSVAQHVFALLLNLATHVNRYAAAPEKWSASPMFTRLDYPISELNGKTLGIVGYGEIGKAVARIGTAFGMEIVALSRGATAASSPSGVTRLPAESFFSGCDVVSLHCPLTPETRHLISKETLSHMKPSAFLINTGRGELVDEADLLAALTEGSIAGAGLDVLAEEPPPAGHPLIVAQLPNLLITPHTAWSSAEARQRLFDGAAANLEAFLAGGEEINRVV